MARLAATRRLRLLLTGAHGLLGSELARVLGEAHEVHTFGHAELDIGDAGQVEAVIRRLAPHWVVNAAAFAKVDACESQQDLAFRVNAQGPRNLALALQKQGGRLLHVSTDYVFPGDRPIPLPYCEDDAPGPLSVYGHSKLAGEQAVGQVLGEEAVIVRTAWLYGAGGPNFLKTILRLVLADPSRTLRVVHDQHGSPTWSFRLARQIKVLLEAEARGLYHATAEGHCTWYELAAAFFQLMDLKVNLQPITTAEYPTPAVRPKNSILENRRLKEAGLNVMRPWQQDLAEFVETFRASLLQEAGG
jgi:dTDP-4-dehydrorhamnose reductase